MIEKLKRLCGNMPHKEGYIFLLSPSDIEDYRNEVANTGDIRISLPYDTIIKSRDCTITTFHHYKGFRIIVLDKEYLETPIFIKEDFINWRRIK